MNFIFVLLLLLFVAFAVYAVVTQFQNTTGGSIPARVAAAMGLAAASLGAALAQWLHGSAP
jgi:hypothetical protein